MIGRRLTCLVLLAGVALKVGTVPARADALSDIKKRGVLIVGVKADYPPFGYRDPNGNIVGIEPDLARDVAKRLGVKLELVPVVAANRLQFLEQGKIDLLIATMNDTAERAKVVGIVEPDYYGSGYNVMVPKSLGITSWAQMRGKPVCAIQGASYNKAAAEKFNLQVSAFTGVAEALSALKQGSCAAFLFDDTAIEGQLIKPEWSSYAMPLPSQDPQPWGLAVKLGEPNFSSFMSRTVVDWLKDGTILRLETKYGIKPNSAVAEAQHQKYAGQ